MTKDLAIRNSTAEFLIFTAHSGEEYIEVKYAEGTVWLSQKMMAKLFDVTVPTINEHLKNIYQNKELGEHSTIRKFRIVQNEANRNVERDIDFYNLDAIISLGYRISSCRATQFRIWATQKLREFMLKGFVLDDDRLKNGSYFGKDYFKELLEKVRPIRASERRIYQQITDIFAECSIDYDKNIESIVKAVKAGRQRKNIFQGS